MTFGVFPPVVKHYGKIGLRFISSLIHCSNFDRRLISYPKDPENADEQFKHPGQRPSMRRVLTHLID